MRGSGGTVCPWADCARVCPFAGSLDFERFSIVRWFSPWAGSGAGFWARWRFAVRSGFSGFVRFCPVLRGSNGGGAGIWVENRISGVIAGFLGF